MNPHRPANYFYLIITTYQEVSVAINDADFPVALRPLNTWRWVEQALPQALFTNEEILTS